MASKIIHTGLKRTALSVALGMCFAGSVLAQSNSTGAIAGTTDAGATVTIENPATGFKREITAGADGSYRLRALPTGSYKVTAKGQTSTVNVTIGGTAKATNVEGVTVTGGGTINAIDVSSVESTTILTAEQIAKIPVARNITSVALLAPGTVRGDDAVRQPGFVRRRRGFRERVLRQRLQHHQLVQEPQLRPGAVRGHCRAADQDRRLRRRVRSRHRRRDQPRHQARYQRVPRGWQSLHHPASRCAARTRTPTSTAA